MRSQTIARSRSLAKVLRGLCRLGRSILPSQVFNRTRKAKATTAKAMALERIPLESRLKNLAERFSDSSCHLVARLANETSLRQHKVLGSFRTTDANMQHALVVILLQVATQAASWSEPSWELIQAPPWSPLAFDLHLLAKPQQVSLNEMKPAFSHCRQFFYMTADATQEADVFYAWRQFQSTRGISPPSHPPGCELIHYSFIPEFDALVLPVILDSSCDMVKERPFVHASTLGDCRT